MRYFPPNNTSDLNAMSYYKVLKTDPVLCTVAGDVIALVPDGGTVNAALCLRHGNEVAIPVGVSIATYMATLVSAGSIAALS